MEGMKCTSTEYNGARVSGKRLRVLYQEYFVDVNISLLIDVLNLIGRYSAVFTWLTNKGE